MNRKTAWTIAAAWLIAAATFGLVTWCGAGTTDGPDTFPPPPARIAPDRTEAPMQPHATPAPAPATFRHSVVAEGDSGLELGSVSTQATIACTAAQVSYCVRGCRSRAGGWDRAYLYDVECSVDVDTTSSRLDCRCIWLSIAALKNYR